MKLTLVIEDTYATARKAGVSVTVTFEPVIKPADQSTLALELMEKAVKAIGMEIQERKKKPAGAG